MIYLISAIIILMVAGIIVGAIKVNVRRQGEISGKHRLDRPELPEFPIFPEFKGPRKES